MKNESFWPNGTVKEQRVYSSGGASQRLSLTTQVDALGRPVEREDVSGVKTKNVYLLDGQVARTEVTDGSRTIVTSASVFDPATGRVTDVYSDDGLTRVQLGYDSLGRNFEQSQFDFRSGSSRTRTTLYKDSAGYGQGLPRQVNEPGVVRSISYNGDGSEMTTTVQSVNQAAGTPEQTVTYLDLRGNVEKTVDVVRNATTEYQYDEQNRLTKTTSPVVPIGLGGATGRPTQVRGYSGFGEATHVKDAQGNITTSAFDQFGRLQTNTYPTYNPLVAGVPTVTPTESFTYFRDGQTKTSTDRKNNVTTYTYDAFFGRPATTTDALGVVSQVLYNDPARQVTESVAGSGVTLRTTTSTRDLMQRTIASSHSAFNAPSRNDSSIYDGAGRTVESASATVSTRNYFDGFGQLIETTDADGNAVVTNTHLANGLVDLSTDDLGRITKYTYDNNWRVAGLSSQSRTGTEAARTSYSYNPAANTAVESDLAGRQVTTVTDDLGRVISTATFAAPSPTINVQYGYDLNGNLTEMKDGGNNSTTYAYTPWNQVETLTEPAVGGSTAVWQTGYDAAGLPVRDVEPGGVSISRTFRPQDGVLASVTSTAAADAPAALKSFGYNAFGQMQSFSSPAGNVAVSFDGYGNLKTAGNAQFTYDELNRMTKRIDAAGETRYAWRQTGQLAEVTVVGKGQEWLGWVGNELRQVRYSDSSGAGTGGGVPPAPSAVGTKREFGYDSIGRLNADVLVQYTQPRVAVGQSPTTVRTAMGWQAYEYDNSGNVSSQTIGFPSSAANGKHLHGYDKAGRLTSWTNPAGTVTGYGYDGSGNRTSAGNVTFEFDARNQLTVEKQGAAVKATFAYTPRGTLKTETRDGVATYNIVDGLGRVMQTGAVAYDYDGLDRITSRAEGPTTGPGTAPVAFAYSGIGSDPVSDGTATYYRTPTGRPVALTRNNQTNWIATNRHGDATMLHTAAPESNPIVGTQAFDPWGTPITPVVAPIGFQSNWTDPTSKQPWMNARWYQPKTASFTSRDTLLGGIGGPSVGHNRHTYANNNPMSYWDPTGRFMEGVCISCIAVGIIGRTIEDNPNIANGVGNNFAPFTYGNRVDGNDNTVYGNHNRVLGDRNIVAGIGNSILGDDNIVFGNKNQLESSNNNVVVGNLNQLWKSNRNIVAGNKANLHSLYRSVILRDGVIASNQSNKLLYGSGSVQNLSWLLPDAAHIGVNDLYSAWTYGSTGALSIEQGTMFCFGKGACDRAAQHVIRGGSSEDSINEARVLAYAYCHVDETACEFYDLGVEATRQLYSLFVFGAIVDSATRSTGARATKPGAATPEVDAIGGKISPQAQARHIEGTPQWTARGEGGYFKSPADAQAVLDAVKSGQAQVIGRTANGQLLVRYDGVTGFNNNAAAGFVDQPTNVFIVKGTSKVSVVPTSPGATAK